MKKMLNEWKEFLNENEGDDYYNNHEGYYVKKMTPAGDLEYFKMIMENDDSYIVEYDPSSEEVTVWAYHIAEEELEVAALRYIQQDAVYDQERLPSEEPEPEENEDERDTE